MDCMMRSHQAQTVRVFYDLETTGFGRGARIAQIAIVLHFSQTEDDERDRPLPNREFCTLINPLPARMDPQASKVTGLTDEMLRKAPTFATAWKHLCGFVAKEIACRVDGELVEIAWTGYNNLVFDDRLLLQELASAGLAFPTTLSSKLSATHRSSDLLVGVKACKNHTLRGIKSTKLCDAYAFHAGDEPFPINRQSCHAEHDALADARATRFVWLRTEPAVRKASGQGVLQQ